MKTVVYQSCVRLSCCSQVGGAVVLCVKNTSLLAPLTDSENPDFSYPLSTIDATLTKGFRVAGNCDSGATWTYAFEYDENDLADPTYNLKNTDITGVCCKGCLTTWIDDEIARQYITLKNEDA